MSERHQVTSMSERHRVTRMAVIAPFYNESALVARFLERLLAVLTGMDVAWAVFCVNDGSADDTLARLVAAHDCEPRIKVIDLSRNFGKEFALTAGLYHCTADVVVVM